MTSRFFIILCLGAMMSCATTGGSSSAGSGTTSSSRASEARNNGGGTATMVDIRKYLPTFPSATAGGPVAGTPMTPTKHVRNQVTVLMDSVAQANRNIKYAASYRILAYTGIERKTAMDLRNNIIRRLPEQKDYLTFKQPTYQLKIGDFFTRVEAQAALVQIQDLLPNALLVQETINIPK